MKKWMLLLPLAALPPLFISTTSILCACNSSVETINGAVRTVITTNYVVHGISISADESRKMIFDPMNRSPLESRAALLSAIPVGTDETKIKEFFLGYFSSHCEPRQDSSGYTCMFDYKEEGSFIRKRVDGFRIDLELDSQRLLSDIRVSTYLGVVKWF